MHGVFAKGEKIVFKVHMDDEDIRAMCQITGTKKAVLFHSDEEATHKIKAMLEEDGVQGLTLQYPEKSYV